jgi:hypothetical protein
VHAIQTDPHNWLLFELAGSNYAGTPEAETKFRIIPNPARDRINVKLTNSPGNAALHLVDASGRIILTQHKLTQNNEIDVHSYPPGMYFVIIWDMNNMYSAKFIIR